MPAGAPSDAGPDGTVHTGGTARWLLWSRLPVVLPFVAVIHAPRRVTA